MNDRVSQIERLCREAEASGVLNGVLGIYKDFEPVLECACGVSDFDTGTPMRVDSVFDLASITKQFTTSAIMLLAQRGQLDPMDPLDRYIQGIPYGVTLEMLMNHTSGMPDEDWCIQYLTDRSRPIDNAKLIEILREQPAAPLFAPGAGWCYSNIAYELLASVVERVSGCDFEQFLSESFFEPAGMKRTRVYHRFMNLPEPEHITHSRVWENGALVAPEKSSGAEMIVPLEGVNGAGLVYTCVGDMNLWDRALREGKILSTETQRKMLVPVPTTRPGEDYGYGWFITHDGQWVHHSGGWPGYINQFYRRPDRPLSVVLLTSAQRDRDALDQLTQKIIALAAEI